MFKNIIFDWSGVIKDAVDNQYWAVQRIFKILGLPEISLEEMRNNWEQPYMLFYNKYVPEMTLEEEQKIYQKVIAMPDYPEVKIYPGIVDLVKKLKSKGVYMVILSGDPTNVILPEIESFGLEGIFQEAIVNVHDKSEKIHDMMEKHKFKPEETVFIGDTKHEIEVGKLVGIKTLAVTWGFCTEKTLKSKNSDYIAHNIKELEDILLK